jgi:hypothetical protein
MRNHLRPLGRLVGALTITLVAAGAAQAQVSWTDWTAAGAGTVTGTLMFNATPIGVTYTGPYSFAQLGCGINYYVPNVYTGVGVPNAPTNCEIIGLSQGGAKTITFSQAVVNPLIALVSWNLQPNVPFNGPLQLVASGCGYWGCGTITTSGNNLVARGEAHGTLRLVGTYTSVTFTDGSENWHGITVGAETLGTSTIPEPSTYALMATGLLGLFAAARRRRTI